MGTTQNVVLDTNQYVKVNTEPGFYLLQSHGDTVRIAFSDLKPAKSNTAFHELGGQAGVESVQSPYVETLMWALAMTDRSKLTITKLNENVPVSIKDPLESNGAVPVNVQDQHSRALDLKFLKGEGFTTLTADTVVGSSVISVTSTTGMAVDKTIGLVNPNGQFYFGEIISIDVLDVTLDTPLDQVFDNTTSNVVIAEHHMNVDGSGTPVTFQIAGVGGSTGLDIDITRIMGNMSNSSAMDDGTFGGLDILTNGCVLRQNNGVMTNIWNVKSNGDIGLLCFDAQYTTRAPAGENGFRFRNTYAGQSKHGVTIRLEPGDTLELIVQDDLTDLTDFQMMAQGHIVTD